MQHYNFIMTLDLTWPYWLQQLMLWSLELGPLGGGAHISQLQSKNTFIGFNIKEGWLLDIMKLIIFRLPKANGFLCRYIYLYISHHFTSKISDMFLCLYLLWPWGFSGYFQHYNCTWSMCIQWALLSSRSFGAVLRQLDGYGLWGSCTESVEFKKYPYSSFHHVGSPDNIQRGGGLG